MAELAVEPDEIHCAVEPGDVLTRQVVMAEAPIGATVQVSLVAGPMVAAALVVGSELGALVELPYAHPTALTGVAIAGGVLLLLGPGMMLPAVVAGAIGGTLAVRTRRMRDPEVAFARTVFRDTLPIDNILITDLSGKGGRAFCTPNVDGSILVNVGANYDDPLANLPSKKTFVHELTHAWQIRHRPATDISAIWEVAVNKGRRCEDIYTQSFAFDGRPWSDWDIEHQAQMVAEWWERADGTGGVDGEVATKYPGFMYIQNNIRMGQA